MDRSLYDYLLNYSGPMYYFASSGSVEFDKIVFFTPMDHSDMYSLTLGNLKSDGTIDVDGTSGNGNTAEVLSTVAKVIAFFLDDYPESEVFIEGTTPARTRLYQIAILRDLQDLGNLFDIYGFDGNSEERFQPGRTYFSFSISSKRD